MVAEASHLGWEEKKVLIIGRASPQPSKKHIETVCTGGITEDGQLLRLYPIPYRYLDQVGKYKLWTWVSFELRKNPSDKRKESFKVRDESIHVLSQVKDPAEQFSLLRKAIVVHREELEKRYDDDWTSLGVIEIELVRFEGRPQKKSWEKDKPYVKQFHLYTEIKPLHPVPIELRLRYRCKNNPKCRTHESALLGWEYMEAFRNFKVKYGSGREAFEQMSRAVLDRFSDQSKRAYALVGTHYRYGSWMVAQLYWFKKDLPEFLF